MLRAIGDFQEIWNQESAITAKVLRALTDASLTHQVAPGGRSLGRVAWHVVISMSEMGRHAGLDVEGPAEQSAIPDVATMVTTYERSARSLVEAVKRQWTDAMLPEKIPMYGEQWPRSGALESLIAHQTHHRGQMTVLMRQAGLAVPGVYGPSREEWGAIGMPAQE
jgi:uncharacterized damage-inducible protein DinB